MLNLFLKHATLLAVCCLVVGCQSAGLWHQTDLLRKVEKHKLGNPDCAPNQLDCGPRKTACAPGTADCAPDGPSLKQKWSHDLSLLKLDARRKDRDAGCTDGSCAPRDQYPRGGQFSRDRQSCPTGCTDGCQACDFGLPRELKKVSLPDYVVEPPDVLLIEVDGSRRALSTELSCGELLDVRVSNTPPVDQFDDGVTRDFKQINGPCRIQSDGSIDLGPEYGMVAVRGLSVSNARRLVELHLKKTLKNPRVFLTRSTEQSAQQISGEHLVRPDGTVSLGIHGSVYVAGLTLSQAQQSIQRHLSTRLADPQVYIDVLAYNSKVYYIVTDGAGAGEQVYRLPCTGNETVLDALAQINGLPSVASKKDIWIARPGPPSLGYQQVLEVDWDAIVRGAETRTNYQVLPGDRIYVGADKLNTIGTTIGKFTGRFTGFLHPGRGTVRPGQFGHRSRSNGGDGF